MSDTMENCNGCGEMFRHQDEAYLFNDMGIVLCPKCKVKVETQLIEQGKLDQSFLSADKNLGKNDERVWKYLKFIELKNEGKKTKIFLVINREEQSDIGIIKWYGAWRQYAFFPERDTLFERVCLRDIADFLDELRAERLKSQISVKKEQEHQDKGEKLFHELTYDKFKEKKKQGAK